MREVTMNKAFSKLLLDGIVEQRQLIESGADMPGWTHVTVFNNPRMTAIDAAEEFAKTNWPQERTLDRRTLVNPELFTFTVQNGWKDYRSRIFGNQIFIERWDG